MTRVGQTHPGPHQAQRPGRLLVIDDDPLAHKLLGSNLQSAGYQVHHAGDGMQGLELTRALRPDLVLCDWNMPRLSGIDYCRSVKSDPGLRATYIALVTSRADCNHKVSGLDAGADDFLVKPVDSQELLARVRAGLRSRRLQDDLEEAQHRVALLELAATIGHEINNPLTALFGHLELVLQYLEQNDPGRTQHHVQQAGEIAARIAEVGQRLITLAEPRTRPYLGDQRMLDLDR